MGNEPENLTLALLRRLDEKIDDQRGDMREVKERLGASISRRVDRIEDRLDRVDRHLDIVPA